MDFKSAFNNKTILIPVLQRDYVQGASETVIDPFLDSLLNSDCDLNYIYGYSENDCFIPVDGQQRLITLWLLHLYIHSRKNVRGAAFKVALKFQTREYATEFCSRLSEKMGELLLKAKDCQLLDNEIEDQNWFISSWKKNATVANMLRTLRYIHKKVKEENVDAVYQRFFQGISPVSFAFLDMTEENGLDDDIYIKMNGRGRPLSAFENLKSWMDQQIENLPIAKAWKGYMDNRWTNLFWKNRNQTQEHPEEIDDEQLHLFCNLLILFHIKNNSILTGAISQTEFREELTEYLEIADEQITDDGLRNKILDNLTKGQMMPLVWLERLHMMPPEFFNFAFNALNAISERDKDINNSGLYFGGQELETDTRHKITRLYELSMTVSTFGRTLPLLYAIICYKKGNVTSFYDWLRVMRNLILNREYKDGETNANLKNVMSCIEIFSDKVYSKNIFDFLFIAQETENYQCQKEHVYQVLNTFNKLQIQEEILKAAPKMRPLHNEFVNLENLRFFSGRIKLLFKIIPNHEFNSSNVRSVVNLLTLIFSGGDNGVTGCFDDRYHYFRRVLMTYHPFWYGFERKKYWSFCNGLNDWRDYVHSENPEALIAFVHEYAYRQLSEDNLYNAIKYKVETISKNYQADIATVSDDSFKYYFIHHPGVWDYMNTKLAIWEDNPYDIVLKKTDSNNSNRMELRTYCLYLDYCQNEDLKAQYRNKGWKIWCWEKGVTCFNLQREAKMSDGETHSIAIDVLFKNINGRRDSENCYALNVFVRTAENEDAVAINETLLLPTHKELFYQLAIAQDKDSGRFVNQINLSRTRIIETLKTLLSNL